MEPPTKKQKLNENGSFDVREEPDRFPLEDLPPEIFPYLMNSLTRYDLVQLSQVSTAFSWIVEDNTWSSSVWGELLRSDFGIADVGAFKVPPRHIYIQRARAYWSPVGLPFPGCLVKDCKKNEKTRRFIENNRIKPFWCLHLGHTNQRTRRVAAEVKKSGRSHFKTAVLHCLELNRVQIEGQAFIRHPGYYRVEWRFMLQSYALHNPVFTTRVLGPKEKRHLPTVYDSNFNTTPDERNSESLYKWEWQAGEFQPERGPDQALPVGDFFEVIVGKIRVKEENSTVFFAMLENGLDWKYDFYIDYVALIPITKEQYETLEIKSPNRLLPPLPAPIQPQPQPQLQPQVQAQALPLVAQVQPAGAAAVAVVAPQH